MGFSVSKLDVVVSFHVARDTLNRKRKSKILNGGDGAPREASSSPFRGRNCRDCRKARESGPPTVLDKVSPAKTIATDLTC